MDKKTLSLKREGILKRVSYALFFASCGVFLSLQLICFIGEVINLKDVISHDVIFLISALLALSGCAVSLAEKITEQREKRFKSRRKVSIEVVFLLLALFWSFIATIFASRQDIVWFGNSYNKEGFFSILGYGAIAVSAYMIKNEDRKKLIKLFVLTSVIPASYLLFVNVFSIKSVISPTHSIYRNSNHYGYALCVLSVVSAGLMIYEKKAWQKVLYGYCFTVLNANLLVSDCFGAHLGQIVGLVCLIVIRLIEAKKLVPTILFLVGLMAISTTILEVTKITNIGDDYKSLFSDVSDITSGGASGGEGSHRYGLWEETIEVIKKSPFFGKGLDCYFSNNDLAKIDMPHNEYLQIASNVGVPVLLFYLAFLVTVYIKAIRERAKLFDTQKVALVGGVGYLFSAFFGNTFLYTYPILIIMIAFGIKRSEKCSK